MIFQFFDSCFTAAEGKFYSLAYDSFDFYTAGMITVAGLNAFDAVFVIFNNNGFFVPMSNSYRWINNTLNDLFKGCVAGPTT